MTRDRALRPIAAALFALSMLVACARKSSSEGDAATVDTPLMAFLSEARALHHQADVHEEQGDVAGAAASMRRLVSAARPAGGPRPEIEEVVADAYARLSELELRRGDLDAGAAAAHEGLAHAAQPTYFRGRLLEASGLVEEARAKALADAGDPDAAARVYGRAIALLEEVVKVQDQVIRGSLQDGGAGRPQEGAR